jgi:hypothetical protein
MFCARPFAGEIMTTLLTAITRCTYPPSDATRRPPSATGQRRQFNQVAPFWLIACHEGGLPFYLDGANTLAEAREKIRKYAGLEAKIWVEKARRCK